MIIIIRHLENHYHHDNYNFAHVQVSTIYESATNYQPHPNLETILVVLEEVCELLGRRHPVVVEGAVPRCEVLEGELVRLEGLLILVDVARPEESLEAGHVLSQHAQLWQDWALKSPKSAFR